MTQTVKRENLISIFKEIEKRQPSFSDRFYGRLFESSPQVEGLFKSVGMEMQGQMVVHAIGVGIANLESPDDLKAIFADLGRRHRNYGVRSDIYSLVPNAFIETCRAAFGDKFDAEVERDWATFFDLLTEAMQTGAERADLRDGSRETLKSDLSSLDDPYLARFLKRRAGPNGRQAIPDLSLSGRSVQVTYLGEKSVEACPMLTALEISLANDIPHVCECGGKARCTTCRVIVIDGAENCLPRNSLEKRLAEKRGFGPEIRLACQTRIVGDVTLKRLVNNRTDAEMAIAGSLGEAGEEILGAVLFTDIWEFTRFSERNLPYDIIHALNLLYRELGRAVDDHGGYVDKFIGDNLMAIFGLSGEAPEQTCANAVKSAFEILDSLHPINDYMRQYLGEEFRLGIGVAFGPMVVGEIGFSLKRQFTAIGDTVNIAARLESETRRQNVELLVSDSAVSHLSKDLFQIGSSHEFTLKGKAEKVLAHEVLPR